MWQHRLWVTRELLKGSLYVIGGLVKMRTILPCLCCAAEIHPLPLRCSALGLLPPPQCMIPVRAFPAARRTAASGCDVVVIPSLFPSATVISGSLSKFAYFPNLLLLPSTMLSLSWGFHLCFSHFPTQIECSLKWFKLRPFLLSCRVHRAFSVHYLKKKVLITMFQAVYIIFY